MKNLKEYAEKQELILEEIFLNGDDNEEFPQNVYADREKMYSVCVTTGKVKTYKLTKEQNVISILHRDEILKYRLSKFTHEDEVSLGDIFMHGGYTTDKEEVCTECGSNDVECKAWVNQSTGIIGEVSNDAEDCWCNPCAEHHKLEEKPI